MEATAPPPRRLRVLFLTTWYPTLDQPVANVFVREHARAASRHHDVTVLHVPDPNTLPAGGPSGLVEARNEELTAGVPTYQFRSPPSRVPRWSFVRLVRGAVSAADTLEGAGPPFDLIHSHTIDATTAGALVARRRSIPLVATEHFSGFHTGDLTRWQILKARLAFPRATAVLPVSGALRDALVRHGVHARFEVVPNAVDTDLFHPSRNVSDHPRRLLFIGRLHPVKRVDLILEAAARLLDRNDVPAWRLDLLGDGPLRRDLEQLAQGLGLSDHVTFHGWAGREEVAHHLRDSAALVLASVTETFGQVVVEALACGVPVVAPPVGALPELVGPDRGILVPAHPQALGDALARVLRGALGIDGDAVARTIASRYSIGAVGDQFDAVYRNAVSTGSRG